MAHKINSNAMRLGYFRLPNAKNWKSLWYSKDKNEYAKKLNPLAMFYMLIAIIMPSLGVTMLTIISIFVGLKLNLLMLLLIACVNAFIQFMFVAMITSSRPPVEF